MVYEHGDELPRGEVRFQNKDEELAYLRAHVAEKERRLRELEASIPPREETAREVIREYTSRPVHEVLYDSYRLSENEISLTALELPPEDDDKAMQELLGILAEKGVKNALLVAEHLANPHIEDDFHRVLAAIVAHGYQLPSLAEDSPLWQDLAMVLFEVTLPEPGKDDRERSLKEIISAMEQFYFGMISSDAVSRKNKDHHFVLEIAVSGEREDIVFYLAVPRGKEDLFEKQLLSVFPKARAVPLAGDYNIFLHDGATACAHASLGNDPILPLKDYRDFDHDPLSVLINTFTKLATVGEGAAVQCVVHPVGDTYLTRYKKVLSKIEKGMSLKEALKEVPEDLAGEVWKFMRDIVSEKKDDALSRGGDAERGHVEEIRKKLETPIVSTNIRIVASARTRIRAEAILRDIEASFNQFYNTNGNAITFQEKNEKATIAFTKQFSFREYDRKTAIPLSVRELSGIIHFPSHTVSGTPQLKRATTTLAPAPVGLPTEGTLLGTNTFRGVDTPIFLTEEDRLRHLYTIGQTGVGKTVFMKNLITQDIDRGDGVCFIDPHGSDIEDVLANIPEHRFDDVIYFDPAYTSEVMGLNMLEFDERFPEQKTFVVNELFSIFKKLYAKGNPESMGPAFEQYFRNATLLVMEDSATGNTMLDISRVLADARYRETKLARCKNPVVRQFWTEIATKAQGEASLANIVPYITNKFDIFTANEIIRPIIAQQKSSFRLREVMDTKKILLVNLSKGRLGDINANLLGMIIVGKILMAALSRVDTPLGMLPPFYLYIDEFQNITTDSIANILSEARKYRLSLTIAHQFIAQLDQGIRDAVFGNVGSMAIFRTGAEDAEFLETQLRPVFEAHDIMNIENRHAYVRVLARGTPQKPFSIRVSSPRKGASERADYIKKHSLQRYARPRDDVEKEILMRYGL